MTDLLEIPEIQLLDSRQGLIRIPDELDIPVTGRVRQLIDTSAFRRLARISQLGLVGMVYPAANHTRFEHSLGVYRNALLFLRRLAHDDRFAESVTASEAEILIAAALLHDIGHWPFCHPIEDMRLAGVPSHEQFAENYLVDNEIADVLRNQWQIDPEQVVSLLRKEQKSTSGQLLGSIISGPVDIDKMDYLYRDSLHAGVPYGKNFDQQRLMGSLCLNQSGNGIALSEKGKTAAEMMVFARYVMFSEVYWHHAVRSATTMFQHAFAQVKHVADLDSLFRRTEHEMIRSLFEMAEDSSARTLLDGLFGDRRSLYKRLAQFSHIENQELYQRLARQPFELLSNYATAFADRLSVEIGEPVHSHEVLFDAPPTKLEVEFNVEIFYAKQNRYQNLRDVSPVVKTLAQQQFDDYVKRVRVFTHPRLKLNDMRSEKVVRLIEQSLSDFD